MDKGRRVVYVCQQCGRESLRWSGRCPGCDQWNTLAETSVAAGLGPSGSRKPSQNRPLELPSVSFDTPQRLPLGFKELDRVLGGGLVAGSLVLIAGEPGIGKSTLLLQVCAGVTGGRGKALYISGEESVQQLKLRADRLGIAGKDLFLLAETGLENILGSIQELSPRLTIIDSIQTISGDGAGAAGSISQVRECTLRLMELAKGRGEPIIITGHVTKDGAIAGPKTLEHMVDTVLYIEGEPFSSYRIVRGVKNRFGSTNEVGLFEMRSQGLVEVDNPSLAFISQRSAETVGSAIICSLEGTRPLLVEVQALTNPTPFGTPRRTANGIDFNRLLLIAAVLSRRAGIPLANQDILVNVTGGLTVNEPAADLGIALAIASSFRSSPVDPKLVALGEIGLSGELRSIPQLERRVGEAARLGFERCLVPKAGLTGVKDKEIEVVGAANLREAFRHGIPRFQDSKIQRLEEEP
ncbi:MAG: DNA repair protein RadA [Chloroflexi bacterium]|nr:DNA repair protein RadA [Chloroflexota bacterium]